ncbi:uncharacterized protein LTR77_003816 [Saxophila tyrrhenica]|uniref:F-box domain-containing protein n=1 Tax=Saxophila tyrrhenica TaxID=1690608 RepID=A0AAV9PEQ0_9PEZI|nr:hypothetical protein LTR77_003816 [Saxophila tyrrhenica]
MADSKDGRLDGKPFRFFKLPRELRDEILKQAAENIKLSKTANPCRGIETSLHTYAPTLRLVSRQFKDKIEPLLKKKRLSLCVRLTDPELFEPWAMQLCPSIAERVSEVTFTANLICD